VIVLDTNVLSEVLRPAPEPKVLEWLDGLPPGSVFTTAITRGEILYGIRVMPDGQRRRKLYVAALAMFGEDFEGRVLNFDSDVADLYAEIGEARRAAGRPISQFDAAIAAIARSYGAKLGTRNAKDFDNCGIEVINPWE
jgi:predicted nucleic acid-binding protein